MDLFSIRLFILILLVLATGILLILLIRKQVLFAEMKFSVVVAISRLFRKDIPLKKVFPEIIDLISATVPAVKAGGVIVFSKDQEYKLQAVAHLTEDEFMSLRIPKFLLNKIITNAEAYAWILTEPVSVGKWSFKGATVCPVEVQDNVVGAFILLHKEKLLPIQDLAFLQTLSHQISLEFEDRLLQTKLEAFSKGLSMVEYSYEKIVDNLPTGIVALDPRGRILLWNKTMSELAKVTGDTTIGRHYVDVFGRTEQIEVFFKELRKTNLLTLVKEFSVVLDSKKILLEITGYPLFDMQNNVIAYIIMHRDITGERELQHKLRQTQERVQLELQEKVSLATRELTEANRDLVRLNKIKSEFVSIISHELKTPLTSIKGYVALLLHGKMGTISDSQKDALSIVNQQSDRLNALITDILDLSKLESGKTTLRIEEVDPVKIVNGALEVLQPQINDKKLEIATDYTFTGSLQADSMKLHQVFVNLLSNAVKFTPSHGKITIAVKSAKQACIIEIKDTGIGISRENLMRIFEPFYQVEDHMTRNNSGTGLGLAIVKRIIELHKGTISASSELGKGTTFTLLLPLYH